VAEIVLKEKIRLADQYMTLNIVDGKITEGIELTRAQYEALALKGAGAPPGVSKTDWESGKVIAAGGMPNYGGGKHSLELGEYAELAEVFVFGILRKTPAGVVKDTLRIPKSKVTYSKTNGLTLTKTSQDAWPDAAGIESVVDGVLTTKD
jgi:hypothetical protein